MGLKWYNYKMSKDLFEANLTSNQTISRRHFNALVINAAAGPILGACDIKKSSSPISEPLITEQEWKDLVKKLRNWQALPISPLITDTICSPTAEKVCFGSFDADFSFAINLNTLDLLARKSGASLVQIQSRVLLIGDWGQNGTPAIEPTGLVWSLIGLSDDLKEQHLFLWNKVMALTMFREIDSRNGMIEQLNAELSLYLSHSIASTLPRLYPQRIEKLDPVQEQQKVSLGRSLQLRYLELYRQYGGQGYGEEGLLIAVINRRPLEDIKRSLYEQARFFGI